MELGTATPVEIDTQLAMLDTEYGKLESQRVQRVDTLHRLDEQRRVTHGRSRAWPISEAETVTSVRRKFNTGALHPRDVDRAREALADLEAVNVAMDENREKCVPLDAEYERRPWQRFFQVHGGHIHSGRWCRGGSIRPTTVRGWRPELANSSVTDAVTTLGARLCSKCFPGAPVLAVPVDPSVCPGSGRGYRPGSRVHRYPNGIGACVECGSVQTLSPLGNVRKHKRSA